MAKLKAGLGEDAVRPTHVALLRGINVGGRNLVSMSALVSDFERAGCRGVRTYIQSGNVVFNAPTAVVRRLAGEVGATIEKRLGFRPSIILRTAVEFESAACDHVHLKADPTLDPDRLFVMFLDGEAAPAGPLVRALDPQRSPGDSFAVVGREIYLHLGNGAAKTKLTNAYFDSALRTISTSRNWRTVQRLRAMLAGE